MLDTILGSKGKMGQTFVDDTRVAVTSIKAGPCVVTQVKKEETDGYWAVQLGFGTKKIKNVSKPLQGHLKGALIATSDKRQATKKAPRFLAEVRFDKEPNLKVGDQIKVSDLFKKGDLVSVTGISKGKGFAGVIKRWGFAMGPRTHGQSDRRRAPGSIGAMGIGRVWKGKKMGGRMGGRRTTIKNLIVVDVNEEKHEVLVSGPVPGVFKGLLIIKKLASGKLDKLISAKQKAVGKKVKTASAKADVAGSKNGNGEEKKAENKEEK